MKALSLTTQKIWPMLKFFADRQTDGQAKNYMPPIFRYGGIKKKNCRGCPENNMDTLISVNISNVGRPAYIYKSQNLQPIKILQVIILQPIKILQVIINRQL
jgi:hypothetical protein